MNFFFINLQIILFLEHCCLCFSHIPSRLDKFLAKGRRCLLLGYSLNQKGYKLYEHIFPFKTPSSPSNAHFPPPPLISHDDAEDACLLNLSPETLSPATIPSENSIPEPDTLPPVTISSENLIPESAPSLPVIIRKSSRPKHPLTWLDDLIVDTSHSSNALISLKESSDSLAFFANISTTKDPTCYTKASQDPIWIEAMNKELVALEVNDTW